MLRIILAAIALLMAPVAASAQPRGGHAGGRPSGFGGGFRTVGPTMLPSISAMPAISPPAAGLSGGTGTFGFHQPRPNFPTPHGRSFPFPYSRNWGGGGWFPFYGYGGYGYGYGYGYGSPYYTSPLTTVQVPVYVPVGPAEPDVQLSGMASADLVLQFPAAAEVWVDGKKGEGEPHAEWTLNSPVLPIGTEYSFPVKARWSVNGKTYEYDRTITVAAGNRSRSLVLTGTEIKE